MSKAFEKLIKETPLRTRLNVSNEMAFINLITELGYRENKMWTKDEDELLSKLCGIAREYADSIIKDINEWEKDGRP